MARALMPAQSVDRLLRQARRDFRVETFLRQSPDARRILSLQVRFNCFQPWATGCAGIPSNKDLADDGFAHKNLYGRAEPSDKLPPAQLAAPPEEFNEDAFERRIGDERAVDVEDRRNSLIIHFANHPFLNHRV